MNVGEQLRLMRKNVGLTQESVAEIMNITRQTLSNWERGINLPDIYTVARLATVYNISLDEVFLMKTFFKGGQNMKTNYGDAQIENLIKKHYHDVQKIQILSGGLVSQTFSFQSGAKKFIFQAGGKKEAYEKERYVSQQYKEHLPVRIIHGIYTNDDGRVYCFSDYIEGCKIFDLDQQALSDVVPSILELLARIASIEIPESLGYGWFDETGLACFTSWKDFISSVYNYDLYNWNKLDSKKVDFSIIQNAITALRENIDFIKLERPCLLHGDIGSYNLLADGTKVSGAIDWSLSLYGDPLYEVANVLFWNEDKLQPLVSALKKQYMNDDLSRKKLNCYIIRIGLEEIYNTAVRGEIGYDDSWIMNRLSEVIMANDSDIV